MKQRLLEIIKKVLTEQPNKKKCDCGCDACMDAPLLNESKQYVMPISENMRYHLDKKIKGLMLPHINPYLGLYPKVRTRWKAGARLFALQIY